MMNIRNKILHSYLYEHNNLNTLLIDAENLCIDSDQDWEKETTTFYFSDSSKIEITPTDYN